MSHTIKLLEGPARSWYSTLIDQVLADHVEIPCRQGLGLESPDALSAIIPGANSVAAALATVDLPRRGDSRAVQQLQEMGWRVIVVWECETRDVEGLKSRICNYLATT